VSLPESIPPPAPPPTPDHADDLALARESAKARVAQMDFAGAERILTERIPVASRDAETEAFAIWVRANLQSDLDGPIEQLGRLVASNPRCEHALYYRGLVQKRAGQRKAALRDFVTLAKQNPSHVGALFEIKELRRTSDE
jgi:tetratricopeptide (TPR) repeat protein